MLDAIIGPNPLAGIGQQGMKYSRMLGCPYVVLEKFMDIPEGSNVMIYALPILMWFERIPAIKHRFNKVVLMTICETETVHEDYGKLFSHFPVVATPSKFCQGIFHAPWNVHASVIVCKGLGETTIGRIQYITSKCISFAYCIAYPVL